MLTVLTMLLGMVGIPVFAANDTWDQSYLVSQAAAANGAPVSAIGDSIEYTMLTGDFFGDGVLSQFTTMSGSMLGSDSQPVCVWPWQIKVTGGSDFVLKITAKQNLYMNLWQNADTTSTWVGNTQISYVVENAKGTRVTLKTLNVEVNVPITTAQYDTHLHLKAGDTAYIIYHKTDEHSATYASNMRVTVNTDAFDASQRTYFPVVTTTLAHTDMVSAQVAAGGAPVDAENVTYQYLYGDVAGQLNAFTEFSGNGSGGADDIVGNPGSDNAVWRWQWRAGDAGDTVLKITAAEDLKLSLSHLDSIPVENIWAFHSTFLLYAANEDGTLVQLAEYPVEAPMNTAAMNAEIHMAAGDSVYLVYGLKDYGNGQVTTGLMPRFTADPKAYDASLRTDFTTEPEETEPEITEPVIVSTVLGHSDMVSAEVAAGGAPVTAAGVTYQYLYGDVAGQLNAFTEFGGNGSGGADDIVGNAGGDNAVWRWQWRAGDAGDTVLKITATENIKLELSHPGQIQGEIWAFHSEFILYTADASGKLIQLADYPVEAPMNTAAINAQIHMAAGDSVYLVYSLKDYGNGQVTTELMPQFTVVQGAYDASLRTEFETPVGYVNAWGPVLQDSIGINFDMFVRTQKADVIITVNGNETVFSDVVDGQRVSVALAAAQMTDTITLRLVDENGNESNTYQYSIRQYADTILAGDYTDTTKALVKAMLIYGAKAQVLFNYNTENLADNGIVAELPEVPETYPAQSLEGKAPNISFYGATLVFRDRTAVRLYFSVKDDVANHTFTVGSETYIPTLKDGIYYIEIGGISPADLDERYSVTVDGTLTITYGPIDYILRMYNRQSSSQELKDAVRAMYAYMCAAEAYI